jgi:CheY-like chemotaxis protein
MLTNSTTTTVARRAERTLPGAGTQRVMIVNGSAEMLGLLESVLDAGRYDVVFVESIAHAYSHIKRVQPDLVILCIRIDEMGGFQVLSMLKLDEETRDIPVLTYTTEFEGQPCDDDPEESAEEELFPAPPMLRLN